MVCLHEKILTKHRSFAEIYHTLNLVLFHQLTYWKREQAKNVHSAARYVDVDLMTAGVENINCLFVFCSVDCLLLCHVILLNNAV